MAIPGDVPADHPGLTQRVLDALARARRDWIAGAYEDHAITDAAGPHQHHWEPILWCCRGCGEFDPPGLRP
jgi:hypothetical protein